MNSLLESRLSSPKEAEEKSKKVRSLAERSNRGELSGYSQFLSSTELSISEKESLYTLLQNHKGENETEIPLDVLKKHLEELQQITQEIRSIAQQSILLHGERIERAQALLSSYTDGAFSTWLITIYGNRQTPYNFLLYYQLYTNIENGVQKLIERMPKQVIYTLAAKRVPISEKIELIKSHYDSPKELLLEEIRKRFPLSHHDKRKQISFGKQLVHEIDKYAILLEKRRDEVTESEKKELKSSLKKIISLL